MLEEQPSGPWYKEVWFWMVMAPLVLAVVISLSLVTIAVKYGDDEVTDDYYKKGRMINQSLEQQQLAANDGVMAELSFDLQLGDVIIALEENEGAAEPELLTLYLDHPVDERLDKVLVLKRFAPLRYRTDLDYRPQYRWYLRLMPGDQRGFESQPDRGIIAHVWRLNGEIDFSKTGTVTLGAP